MCAAVFSVLPVDGNVGTFLGLVIGILLTLFVIKSMFSIALGQAFLVWIFHFVAYAIAQAVGVATFGLLLMRAIAG